MFDKFINKLLSKNCNTCDNCPEHENTGSDALPLNPRHDDLYLVSFPKSGTTWLDFIVANVNVKMSHCNEEVNVFNIHDFVPDIHYSKNIGDVRTQFPNFRFIKSHANYNPNYKKVVYLIRDPRDVMVSYYHFSFSLNQPIGSLSDFIRSPRWGIDSWCKHVKSWFEDSPVAMRIYFMRYEDLKKDTLTTMKAMYKIIGLRIPDTILQEAIELSSFPRMKESEKAWNYGGRPSGKNMNFMRKGISGSHADEISEEDIGYINAKAGRLMQQFDYAIEK